MDESKRKEISPLTKVLIDRVHGGRKQDSKFWASETDFQEGSQEIPIPRRAARSRRRGVALSSSVVLIFTIGLTFFAVALRPDLFPFLDRHWLHEHTVQRYGEKFSNSSKPRNERSEAYATSDIQYYPSKTIQKTDQQTGVLGKKSNTPISESRRENELNKLVIEHYPLKGKVFSWQDENGNVHFSNTTFPANNDTLRVQTELNTYRKVTPVKIVNNQIYIPVTIENRGLKVKINMLLDTGCSHTVVPYRYLNRVKPTYGQRVTATVANGSKSYGHMAQIDHIVVGSNMMSDFMIRGAKVAGSDNTGLLGLDFLKRHPFKIDFENELVVWM